jgi:hypothetical protein
MLNKLLDSFYNKLFVAGNVVITQELKDIREKIEKGVPLNEQQRVRVMNWMFQGSNSYMKQRSIDLAAKVDAREERVIDNLLNAFQYGKIGKADVVEGEFEIKKDVDQNKINVNEQL